MSKPHAIASDKPRILIAEGPWGIQEGSIHWDYGTIESYDKVTHKCGWTKNWFYKTFTLSDWNMKQENPYCPHCDELVPNMIQTLWTLKNMDKIQNDATYGNKPWATTFYVGTGQFYVQQEQLLNSRPGQVIQYNPKVKP